MKRWVLIVLFYPLWFLESAAQINLQLNSSNTLAHEIMFHNPAGIPYPQRIQASVGSQILWAGLSGDNLRCNFLSYLQPVGDNTAVGLRGGYFTSNLFQEGNLSVLLGRKFFDGRFSIGVNANLLFYSYNVDQFQLVDMDDPVVAEGHSKNAFSAGLGLLLQPSEWLSLGGSVDHINMPDITITNSGIKKRRVFKFGMCLISLPLNPQVELRMIDNDVLFQTGVRQGFLDNKFSLFAGYDFLGSIQKDLFFEASLILGQFGLSYHFQYPLTELNQITSGSHSVRFIFSQRGFPIVSSLPNIRVINLRHNTVVESPELPIVGKISHKEGITTVEIRQNNDVIHKNTYEVKPKVIDLKADISLVEGKNEIEIVAYSEKTSRSKRLRVICKLPIVPPKIEVLSDMPVATDTAFYAMHVKITDYRRIERAAVRRNNQEIQSYHFEGPEKTAGIQVEIPLQIGRNLIEIQAANSLRDTTRTLEVVYAPPIPPKIVFLSPREDTVDTEKVRFHVEIEDERGLTGAKVIMNGEEIKCYTYPDRDLRTEILLDIPLKEGMNSIQVSAENDRRRARDSISVIYYEKVLPTVPPTITVLSPNDLATSSVRTRLSYRIENIDSLNQIQVTVNGNRLPTESIRVIERTGNRLVIEREIQLREGQNRINLTASNDTYTANKDMRILYNPLLGTSLYRKTWAIIIGINNYRGSGVPQVPWANLDAYEVEKILWQELQFDHSITLYDEMATQDDILTVLTDSLKDVGPEDGVFVFFAGHGFTEKTDEGLQGYVVPYNGMLGAHVWAKNISVAQLEELSNGTRAKHVFFVLDCICGDRLLEEEGERPGPSRRVNYRQLRTLTSRRSRFILTAGDEGDRVSGGSQRRNSIFITHFLEGLRGAADLNRDSYVTATEISHYVQQKVIQYSNARNRSQTPQFGRLTSDEGEFVFKIQN